MKRWSRSRLLSLVVCASAATAALAQEPAFPEATPESQGLSAEALQELAGLVRGYVEQDLVVGGELVVIKSRRVVLHETFGFSSREDETLWAKGTICNIRSMSKCLTGAAAQILIEEGRLGLDDPVSKYLPSFDNEKSGAITVRHLLTHRSGLPLTMLDRIFSKYESLRVIADEAGARGPDFEPGSDFQYSDTGSEVLGAVIEVAAGEPLLEFVRTRLIEPLGMTDTFTVIGADDPRRARMATLYYGAARNWNRIWKPDDEPFYTFGVGSQGLYSTPLDYARFLAMWMDGGVVGETRVLAPAAIERTLTPVSKMKALGSESEFPSYYPGIEMRYGQMAMVYVETEAAAAAPPVAYGHGGSDGTYAIAWPQRDLMLLYFTQSRGQGTSLRLEEAIDRLLLHPGSERAAEAIPARYRPYLGRYVADYAQHVNEVFEVLVHGGALAVDVPSQMIFELHDPDAEGRWVFKLTDAITVTFERDAEGTVDLMQIHQAGLTFDVPREGTERERVLARAKDIDEAVAAPYLGLYYHPERDANVEILLRDKRLLLDVPEFMTLELLPPDEERRWALRLNPTIVFTFQRDVDGAVVSMTRIMEGTKLVLPRVDGS